VAAFPVVTPSGPMLRRGPAGLSSGGDPAAPALMLTSLALLLLVGTSAWFLHATARASDSPPRMRSA
jgi:hypothetical protein